MTPPFDPYAASQMMAGGKKPDKATSVKKAAVKKKVKRVK